MHKTIIGIAATILAFGAACLVRHVYAQDATTPPVSQIPAQQQPAVSQGPNTLASQTANQAPSPIRATTRLVQVSVIVHDKHGNPIAGLTKDDFVVFDEKKPQAIQVFLAETNRLEIPDR
jgi:hypothetical protein